MTTETTYLWPLDRFQEHRNHTSKLSIATEFPHSKSGWDASNHQVKSCAMVAMVEIIHFLSVNGDMYG